MNTNAREQQNVTICPTFLETGTVQVLSNHLSCSCNHRSSYFTASTCFIKQVLDRMLNIILGMYLEAKTHTTVTCLWKTVITVDSTC